MDYSNGVLNAMSSPFFPKIWEELGPYLIDKTELIERIIDSHHLLGHVDLVL